MKQVRFVVVLLLALSEIVLSSCAGIGRRPADGSGEQDAADTSVTDSVAASAPNGSPSEPTGSNTESGSDSSKSAAAASVPDGSPSEPAESNTESGSDSSKSAATASDAHVHKFIGATCTEPGKCECGAKGSALGHNFAGGSCTEATVCTRCGARGSALGHHFAAATCTAPKTCTRCKITSGNALGHNYSGGRCSRCGDTHGPLTPEEAKLFKNKLTDEQNAQSLAVAREIVKQINQEYPNGSDFDRIAMAAELVSTYYDRAGHTESGNYYNTPYGVFILHQASCAGCCRALGLVLACMGYQWTHVNENQWTHQWVTVTVNGETIWADGQIGWAGVGEYPFA